MATTNLPHGLRRGHDDSIACAHRDVSVCPRCEQAHVELINVYGRNYWVPMEADRQELAASLDDDSSSCA